MRLIDFDDHRLGVLEGETVRDITHLVDAPGLAPELRMNVLIKNWAELRPQVERLQVDRPRAALLLQKVRLNAPIPSPRHIFALPANFVAHIGELGTRRVTKGSRTAREQGFFLKAPGSISGPADAVRLPKQSQRRFDHECELAVIIGREAADVPRQEASTVVFGYTCLIDLTLRIEADRFEEERSMRKSFSTFTPLGPVIVTADEIEDLQGLHSRLYVNGDLRQSASLADMIVDVDEAVELVSSVLPVGPGDIIAMGTPSGVGPVSPGDELRIEIDTIGEMTVNVVDREAVAPRPY